MAEIERLRSKQNHRFYEIVKLVAEYVNDAALLEYHDADFTDDKTAETVYKKSMRHNLDRLQNRVVHKTKRMISSFEPELPNE